MKPYYPIDDEIDSDYEGEPNGPQSKIIARMPSLDERPSQIKSRLDSPNQSVWGRLLPLNITDRQQNRILWCAVAILLCVIICTFFGGSEMSQVSNESTKPNSDVAVDSFRIEGSTHNSAASKSSDFDQITHNDPQPAHRFTNDLADDMIMPPTIIDMNEAESTNQDFANVEYSNRDFSSQPERNTVRSAWNRNENVETIDNSIVWNSQAAYSKNQEYQDYAESDYSAFASDQLEITAIPVDDLRQNSYPASVQQYNNRQPSNQYANNYEQTTYNDQQRYAQPAQADFEMNQYNAQVQSTPFNPNANASQYGNVTPDPRYSQTPPNQYYGAANVQSNYATEYSTTPYQNREINPQNSYSNQGTAYSQPLNNGQQQKSLSEYYSTNYRESIPQTPSQPNAPYSGVQNNAVGQGQGYAPQSQPYSTAGQAIDPRFVR